VSCRCSLTHHSTTPPLTTHHPPLTTNPPPNYFSGCKKISQLLNCLQKNSLIGTQLSNEQEFIMKNPLFRIFVSSTYIDLIDYRKAAEKAINDLKQKYVGMEHIGALTKEPVKASLEMVEECDLFIGIYAWRYGTIPRDSDLSITEEEYQYAQKLDRPCLCYLVAEDFPWMPAFMEDSPGKEKLRQFKSNISEKHVRDIFKEPHTLEYNILRDISNWLAENRPELKRDALKPGQEPLKMYCEAIAKKYATLTMIGFKRSFTTDSIYIPLTVHVDPESRFSSLPGEHSEKLRGRPLTAEDLLHLPYKVAVVLGEPGMGHHAAVPGLPGKHKILESFSHFCKTV
jgi:hypothetical protein